MKYLYEEFKELDLAGKIVYLIIFIMLIMLILIIPQGIKDGHNYDRYNNAVRNECEQSGGVFISGRRNSYCVDQTYLDKYSN